VGMTNGAFVPLGPDDGAGSHTSRLSVGESAHENSSQGSLDPWECLFAHVIIGSEGGSRQLREYIEPQSPKFRAEKVVGRGHCQQSRIDEVCESNRSQDPIPALEQGSCRQKARAINACRPAFGTALMEPAKPPCGPAVSCMTTVWGTGRYLLFAFCRETPRRSITARLVLNEQV
jgi:hypothetical protein